MISVTDCHVHYNLHLVFSNTETLHQEVEDLLADTEDIPQTHGQFAWPRLKRSGQL